MSSDHIKVIILAAGYGTRLEKDIEESEDEEIKSRLLGIPKPLLPIAGKSLISRWMSILEDARDDRVDPEIIVIVNQKHIGLYEEWRDEMKATSSLRIQLVNDGSTNNENRLGAIHAIRLGIQGTTKGLNNFLVIAGDTLYYEDFNLKEVIDFFYAQLGTTILCCSVSEEDVSKRGIIEINQDSRRVTSLMEKPAPTDTESRLQCPAFYLFNEDSAAYLEAFLCETKGKPLASRDAPGHFLKYLIPKSPVYAFSIKGRFDVGGLESYLQCHKAFLVREN
eukprot:TRINITY_DN25331_c0_g1_i1.p1 TRINITY_DN25331_c0_g1~~TRINITY_DN25331_c0_g1_i1.p1  ORF type:complete len:279 (-),score=36.21 TRINITY_DN25331_c0_g1_i1:417-1253(-)